MKNLIYILGITTLFFSCENQERSVGFTNWSDDGTQYKFHLGTEASVDIVKSFDKMIVGKNYDELRSIFSDTAVLTFQNGYDSSLQDFIYMNLGRDSTLLATNATLKWDLQRAFSVDLDPKSGGEHVYASYLAKYQDKEQTNSFNADLWFYIIDGKIITVNQYNQDIIDE